HMTLLFSSSRRRHTSFSRDWSSDVCSSDLCQCEIHVWKLRLCVEVGRLGNDPPAVDIRMHIPSVMCNVEHVLRINLLQKRNRQVDRKSVVEGKSLVLGYRHRNVQKTIRSMT